MQRLKYTALHRAILDCRVAQVRLLIEQCGADANSQDLYGRTPLMLCCALENQRAAAAMSRLVLAAGPDLTLKDQLGRTALAYACLFNRESLVVHLAESGVIDPTEPDNDGCTPLHHAAVIGNSRIVCLLVRACAEGRSSVDCRNRLGWTPLMLACRLRRYHCALFLLLDGGASGFLKDDAHFLSALEWLRCDQPLPRKLAPLAPPPLSAPQQLRRADTAPEVAASTTPRQSKLQQQRQQPITFITEYSSLDGAGGSGRLSRSRTFAGGFASTLPPPPPPPPPMIDEDVDASSSSRPTTFSGGNNGGGRRSRYTSASGDTVYVNVDELSVREARDLLAERLRAQAVQFPYPTVPKPKLAPAAQQRQRQPQPQQQRPNTRDLQALRPPPRYNAVSNACQLLELYHAAMSAPKPATVLREDTGISELTIGSADTAATAAAAAAQGEDATAKDGDEARGSSAAAGAAGRDHKKSVKFKDVSK
ncbi:hypothetical protein BOX15_Mlig019467g2 [Macrostomum lignano]|uniref:Uncharacterized protein n=1 Tax=Macrostomum lignano TaxID=282301 RepID=A0A267DVW6_9PLAT|nr:hypothetical protein BOX15_Mlig019467g2 [Macrostomum lignano]